MKFTLKAVPAIALALAIVQSTPFLPGAFAAGKNDTGWMDEDQAAVQQQAPEETPAQERVSTSTTADGTPLLKGGVTYCVPRGTPIKLKLASVPNFGMKMLQRDLDGKLVPAKLNEEITAKTTEDIYVDDNKVIPQGTVFHGAVTRILPPRRVGRPGSLVLTFDSFETPDGRKFAFHAEADNAKKSTAKSKARGFGIIAAHAAGGAVVGALIAYEIFGLQETIAMHGYNIAGAAAAGALAGTAVALLRHGPRAVLEPGDDLNMEIDTDLLLPAATHPSIKAPPLNLPGLDVKVLSTKVLKDGLDGYQLNVKAQIENNTNRRLESIDLFVEDDNGSRYSIVSDVREDKMDMLFTINPYSTRLIYCDFGLEYPKLKRKLVWLDHDSRQVLYETRLP